MANYYGHSALVAAATASRPDFVIICLDGGRGFDRSLGETLSTIEVPFAALSDRWSEAGAHLADESGALAFFVSNDEDMRQSIVAISAAMRREAELRELRDRMERLTGALQQARTISTATGVLMERMHLGRQHAFDLLRAAARAKRSRLSEFAELILKASEALNELWGDSRGRSP